MLYVIIVSLKLPMNCSFLPLIIIYMKPSKIIKRIVLSMYFDFFFKLFKVISNILFPNNTPIKNDNNPLATFILNIKMII